VGKRSESAPCERGSPDETATWPRRCVRHLGRLALGRWSLASLLVGLAVSSLPSRMAQAQYVPYGPFEVYPGQVFREGPGFRVFRDGLVLHPGVAAELGYDSNPLLASKSAHSGVFRLRAHVDLATLPPQRLDSGVPTLEFRLGAAIEYRQYFSTDYRVGNMAQVNAQSDAELQLFRGRPLSLRAYNQFLVTNDARNLEIANNQTFAPRIFDRLGVLGTYRPRNGPLEIGLGESFRVDHFVQSELERSRALSNDIQLYGQLRVLPETLVRLDVRSSYVSFYGSGSPLPPSAPLRIIAGAQSMLWRWLGASLYLGYGNSLHHNVPPPGMAQLVGNLGATNYSGFVGGLEARLHLLSRMRLSAGYARDFFDSIYATFFVDDRVYVHYEHGLWRSLSARVNFDTYFRQYGTLVAPPTFGYRAYRNGVTTRGDVLISLSAEATFRPFSFLEVGASYSVLDNETDFGFVDGTGIRNDAAFAKHVLLFKADLAY